MRKCLCMVIVLMLIFGGALAELDTPAPSDPAQRYAAAPETDGSEQSMFDLVEDINDELANVAEHGSLMTQHCFLNEAGEVIQAMDITLQDSEYGPMIITDTKILGRVYSLEDADYVMTIVGSAARSEEKTWDEFDWFWESYYFPYDTPEAITGVRQDEAGNTYMLIQSVDDMSYEFAMDGEMKIQQLRAYKTNAEGVPVLNMLVDYSTGPAKEIPEDVLKLMQEDFNGK